MVLMVDLKPLVEIRGNLETQPGLQVQQSIRKQSYTVSLEHMPTPKDVLGTMPAHNSPPNPENHCQASRSNR
jgi:hypothetical protein